MDPEDRWLEVASGLLPHATIELAWINPLGGATYRAATASGTVYLKVAPDGIPTSHDPLTEASRLRWIGDRFAVPQVLAEGRCEGFTWMTTTEPGGVPASDARFRADPVHTARRLGATLRAFHDALGDASDCPWSWRIDTRFLMGRQSATARDMLRSAPPENDLVVAHGDFCAPNILLEPEDEDSAVVDLGKLGVADRAADLGCQVWSLEFNDMADQRQTMLDAYGFTGRLDDVLWYRDYFAVV